MAGGTLKKDWGDTTRHAEGYALGEGERKAKERETERDTHTERKRSQNERGWKEIWMCRVMSIQRDSEAEDEKDAKRRQERWPNGWKAILRKRRAKSEKREGERQRQIFPFIHRFVKSPVSSNHPIHPLPFRQCI